MTKLPGAIGGACGVGAHTYVVDVRDQDNTILRRRGKQIGAITGNFVIIWRLFTLSSKKKENKKSYRILGAKGLPVCLQ